jgi:hypothetical protein
VDFIHIDGFVGAVDVRDEEVDAVVIFGFVTVLDMLMAAPSTSSPLV